MKNYKTFTEVERDALEDGMTVTDYYMSTPAEWYENVDWTK